MNRHDIINALSTVDDYTQLSCLGSMVYTVTSQAIRQAVKLMPEPSDNTEAFLNEERNLKLDEIETELRDLGDGLGAEIGEVAKLTTAGDVATTPGNYLEQRRELQALLDLRRDLLDMSESISASLGGDQREERTIYNTMTFMAQNMQPDAKRISEQYTTLMRLGAKNYGQTRAQFVETEMKRAAEQYERFLAKCEIAVQYLEGLEPHEGPIDPELIDKLAQKCVDKLIARRVKIGLSLTWRSSKEQREQGETDILFIEKAIEALGGEVPAEVPVEPETTQTMPDLQQMVAAFMAALNTQQDPKAPGPVTITKH